MEKLKTKNEVIEFNVKRMKKAFLIDVLFWSYIVVLFAVFTWAVGLNIQTIGEVGTQYKAILGQEVCDSFGDEFRKTDTEIYRGEVIEVSVICNNHVKTWEIWEGPKVVGDGI